MAVVFEVELNGERFASAGHEALCVLSVHVTASGKLGEASQGTRRQDSDFSADLHISGLTSFPDKQRDVHMSWGDWKSLQEGDVVTIRVQHTGPVDPPTQSHAVKRYGGARDAISERRQFRKAQDLYSRLVFKYGSKREVAAYRTRKLALLRRALP